MRRQQRFVVMLPYPLKRRFRAEAERRGITMKALMIELLEDELGADWREPDEPLPGTQRLFAS